MFHHLHAASVVAFIKQHGYALLFWWVLAEQSGLPVPSIPILLAAGALIRTGQINPVAAVAACVIATMIADTIWFQLGRHRGRQVLRLLCRISLEPDSCVRQTENAFLKYGLNSLLVSKFIPGLNAVAAPLAGNSRSSYRLFALYDGTGALLWSASFLALGYLFSEQLETILAYAATTGANMVLFMIAVFALWLGWKFLQRRRFMAQLKVARITPAELQNRLNAGEEMFIVDLRSGYAEEPGLIPGAVRFSTEQLAAQTLEIPRDREIILFCS